MRKLVAGVVASAGIAAAGMYVGRVVGVIDGDTLSIMRDGKAERVRLSEIDAPEKHQPFGQQARNSTGELAYGKEVTVEIRGKDKWGRTVGRVTLPDGKVLNDELIDRGDAWWYARYSTDSRLEERERQARQDKKGLWSDPQPQAPWEYRRPNGRKSAGHAADAATKKRKKSKRNVRECGARFVCSDFSVCEDAVYQLTKCGMTSLDNDHDGVPCEAAVCADMAAARQSVPPAPKQ